MVDPGKTILRFESVTKRFGSVTAVDDVSLDIQEGEFITLLGPSGSGKSTMLLLVAGFESLTRGEIYLDGQPMSGMPPHRRRLGIVFQNYALFPHLSVLENIAFALRNLRWAKDEIRARVSELLDLVRLDGYEERMPHQLSGGQQQRVALARALAFRPRVLLLDEPLGALDKKLREHMLGEFQRIHRTLGATMVFVTHDQEEALAMSDRIAVLDSGRIVRLGTPREMYEDPLIPFVADFLGETNVFSGRVVAENRVAVDDGGWEVGVPHRVSTGTSVQIAIRPEKVSIGQPDDGANSVSGTVEEVLYLGPTTSYSVRLTSGQIMTVKQFNRYHATDLDVGAEVTLHWQTEDARLLEWNEDR